MTPPVLADEIERAADRLIDLAQDARRMRSHGAVERLIDGLEGVEQRIHRLARGVPRLG